MRYYLGRGVNLQGMSSAIYTIGHSNHPIEHFYALLGQHHIHTLVDVRTSPYSQYAAWFNKEELSDGIKKLGLQYYYAGKHLGGRPTGSVFYDKNGYALYDVMAADKQFIRALSQLRHLAAITSPLVIMCSEENPRLCHRGLLISRVLDQQGVDVQHIMGDGSVQPHRTLFTHQLSLIDGEDEWKSIRSVLQPSPQESSSTQ